MLKLHIFRIPKHRDHVSWRKIANAAFSIFVRPSTRSLRSPTVIVEPVDVQSFEQEILRILVIVHVVLLVSDDEVMDSFGDRVVWIFHPDLESANRRMAC